MSLAAIARELGVHTSTVSLALRDMGRVSAVQRERIKASAARMGYVPDPLLVAFNHLRHSHRPRPHAHTVAFVTDTPVRRASPEGLGLWEILAGIKMRAAELSFSVDTFQLGDGKLSASRLDEILHARGISLVAVGPLSLGTATLPLHWERYCVAVIDSFHLLQPFDRVTLDHSGLVRDASATLRQKGCERIGFLCSTDEDLRLAHLPLAGFLLEEPVVPPLIHDFRAGPSEAFRKWCAQHRPDGLICGCHTAEAWLAQGGAGAGASLPWVSSTPAKGSRLHRLLGSHATEMLAARRQANQTGLPLVPSTLQIDRHSTLIPIS